MFISVPAEDTGPANEGDIELEVFEQNEEEGLVPAPGAETSEGEEKLVDVDDDEEGEKKDEEETEKEEKAEEEKAEKEEKDDSDDEEEEEEEEEEE